ncbi:unnamed protein product [Chilo suppressalis]|uniref:Uncharacterized protein n=1 Tax=Chilo suppressalis TaxID=168631 RepID=A0ABN8LET3_CHISP|nr:unnamed protein product [Chilo suppressalis]
MTTSNKMLLSCVVACSLVAMATAQGNEYLPPSKGYNYEPPSVPFPTNNNGNKQPTPGPFRPPPPTPGPYRPPVTRPAPPAPRPTRPNTYVPPPPTPNHDHDHEHHDEHHHHEPGMPFDFSYAVNEDGNDYSHNAISDGDVTRGEYRVALPDGRTQVVKYTADWKNGFNAEVTYEGEARYPDQQPGYGSGPASGGQKYVPPSQGGGYQY